jgi:hypothetical protein
MAKYTGVREGIGHPIILQVWIQQDLPKVFQNMFDCSRSIIITGILSAIIC